MISESETRQLLIESCHSSPAADARIAGELASRQFVGLLVTFAVDADDYGGDAPMQAAYYLCRAEPALVQPHEAALVTLLSTANGYAGSIAFALGRIQSEQAKPEIARMLFEGLWPEQLYREAMSFYDK